MQQISVPRHTYVHALIVPLVVLFVLVCPCLDFIFRYMESCKEALGTHLHSGFACDKATDRGLNLASAVGALTSGIMVVLPPLVACLYL